METQVNTSSEIHQHLTTPTDLRFKLNKMHSWTTSSHEDPESHRADHSQKRTRGHHASTHKKKENTFPIATKIKDDSVFTPMKLPINQILHVMKHQPWVRLPKPSKYDPDFLEARGYGSFHGSLRYATVHCWALKRHLEDLVNVDTSKSSSST